MRLAELVETSLQIAATPARLEKLSLLAGVLQRLAPDEVPVGVAWLAGHLRQGRSGLGWAALQAAVEAADAPERQPDLFEAPPEGKPPLELGEVDREFERIAATRGARAAASRRGILGRLLRRA